MKTRRAAGLTAILFICCQGAAVGLAAYYPSMLYREFEGQGKEAPPPDQQDQPQPPAAQQRTESRQPPEFLFPKELGFGVAVAVPYDMFYLSGAYYLVRQGKWHRSSSYRGPWNEVTLQHLPPQLLKHDLAAIRRARNREFQAYWENRERYRGKVFRPGRGNGKKRPD